MKGTPKVQRDAQGIAIGGVRTAANDVPVAALSGDAPTGTNTLCALFGSTRPFDHATLVRLYRTKACVPGEVPSRDRQGDRERLPAAGRPGRDPRRAPPQVKF